MITCNEEQVTPAQAQLWLTTLNKKNRPLNKTHVQRLANEMIRDGWKVTHQGIAFASNGELIDGQHRLSAVLASGVTIKTLVFRGEDPSCFTTIDASLRTRGGSDIFALDGVPNSTAAAAVVRVLGSLLEGDLDSDKYRMISPAVALELYRKYEKHVYPFTHIKTTFHAPVLASLSFAHIKYPAETLDFFDHIKIGANLVVNHPALLLRAALQNMASARGGQSRKMKLTLLALRYYIEQRFMQKLIPNDNTLLFFQ